MHRKQAMSFSLNHLIRVAFASLLTLLSVLSYSANENITVDTVKNTAVSKAMPDNLYLSVGGYVISQSDMTIALSDKDVGAGVAIRPRRHRPCDVGPCR